MGPRLHSNYKLILLLVLLLLLLLLMAYTRGHCTYFPIMFDTARTDLWIHSVILGHATHCKNTYDVRKDATKKINFKLKLSHSWENVYYGYIYILLINFHLLGVRLGHFKYINFGIVLYA